MTASSGIGIACVPGPLLLAGWRLFAPLLAKGAAAARVSLDETVALILADRHRLWVVTDRDGVIGVFLTTIGDVDGARALGVHGLAGGKIRAWAARMGGLMCDLARTEGCRTVRFAGRPGWGRIVPDFKPIGRHPSGVTIFERAAT